jgi:hypothetical protein
MTQSTISPPLPESVTLYKQIIKARLTVERTDADLSTARLEHEAARAHLAALEAEYRTIRVEHVA